MINYEDLKLLCIWLNANKISLNSSNNEAMLFRHPNKNINYDRKLKIEGKRIFLTNSVKYLGIYWEFHIPELCNKLPRATLMH